MWNRLMIPRLISLYTWWTRWPWFLCSIKSRCRLETILILVGCSLWLLSLRLKCSSLSPLLASLFTIVMWHLPLNLDRGLTMVPVIMLLRDSSRRLCELPLRCLTGGTRLFDRGTVMLCVLFYRPVCASRCVVGIRFGLGRDEIMLCGPRMRQAGIVLSPVAVWLVRARARLGRTPWLMLLMILLLTEMRLLSTSRLVLWCEYMLSRVSYPPICRGLVLLQAWANVTVQSKSLLRSVRCLVRLLVTSGPTMLLRVLFLTTCVRPQSARPTWRLAIWFRGKPQAWTCLE